MAKYDIPEGEFTVGDCRFAVVAARFNHHIVDKLLAGATDAFTRHGVGGDALTVVRVPGAYEIPVAAQALAATGKYAAIVALGAVVRGDTPHFDFVAGECAQGITRVGLDYTLPVIFGVLTTETDQQARDRAGGSEGNKGAEAALAAMEMTTLLKQLSAS